MARPKWPPGTLKEGGSARRAAVERLIQCVGGTLEAFYYAFGEDDIYAIVDCPDNVSVAAASLTVAAGGGGNIRTVVLLTPAEVDQIAKKATTYRAPGT
ncbi:MAG TPA: GYD domain-containing protein [Chloroflexota bacterium]|nr:GYD domain-containing protein [Chloroflexota bacterium]